MLADQAATCAAETLGRDNVTMMMSANFPRPARIDDEYILVVAKTLHVGKRSIVVEVEALRPSGETVLKATFTQAAFDTRVIDRV